MNASRAKYVGWPTQAGRDDRAESARGVFGREAREAAETERGFSSLADLARHDGRLSDVVPASRRKAALRSLVLAAGLDGVKRVSLAVMLGVPESTLRHWLSPGDADRSPPVGVLVSLAGERSLPEAARVAMLESLLEGSGLSVVVSAEADPEQAPLSTQLVQAQEAIGTLASRVLGAIESGGEGGVTITRDEAASVVASVTRVQRELAELAETARRMGSQA